MSTGLQGVIVEEQLSLTLHELCRASHAGVEQIQIWVIEGVLEPEGNSPEEWRFSGLALARTRRALRLTYDLDVNPAGVALALDLLDEIATLERRLRCHMPAY
jgi:chaperone modulatory protein CbpM